MSVKEETGGIRELGKCVPGLPKATHVAGYVAGNAEVWGFGLC